MATRRSVEGMEFKDTDATVEPIAASTDFRKLAADEAFMNEPVEIEVYATTDENQPPHIILNVNNMNQPVIRGIPTTIKRKYVEVLARMKETKYTQHTPNPSAPDVTQMVSRSALSYPFELIHDANPKGRAWLQHVLAEPA